jgi:hypothetical protein
MRPIIHAFGHGLTPLVRSFHRSLDNPQAAQAKIQAELCDRLIHSDYGAHYGIHSIADWEKLPIVDYDDIQDWIDRQLAHPHHSILTPEPILFCEHTSGSIGPAKRIPYTRGLRQSFSQMFCIWAQNLIQHGPQFSTGKVYFCVSPKFSDFQTHQTPDSQPLSIEEPLAETMLAPSFQDDSDYLEPWLQRVLSPFLVTLPHLGRLRSPEEFQQALCSRLLKEARLETISIWSPSFLEVQLAYLQQHRHHLLQCLDTPISDRRRQALMADPIVWEEVWPQLKFISCWDSATAADQADHLRSLFPGVCVQGKGLLATEAPMTVPLILAGTDADYSARYNQEQVPLVTEVFFEFETVDAVPTVYQLHELQEGQEYRIVVSQKGGLYRYRMGDRIRVTHRYRQTPCLQFLGRDRSMSDMVGEKLNGDFVARVLNQLPLETVSFKSLIPVLAPHPHYMLLLEQNDSIEQAISSLASQLESGLCRAYHYRQARLLGQLAEARVYVASGAAEVVIQQKLRAGQRWGDMKHSLLEPQPWPCAIDYFHSCN